MKLNASDREYVTRLLDAEAKHLRTNAREYVKRAGKAVSLEADDDRDRAAINQRHAAVLDAVSAAIVGAR